MTRELNRVTFGVLIAFLIVALSVTFWTVVQARSLLAREDNARNVIEEQRIHRGTIYDRNGAPLAYTVETASGIARRVYPHPEAAGAVGYYSFKYGEAGIEAAYNEELRGDNLRSDWEKFWDRTLHRPQEGSDVRATIDLAVQKAATQAMGVHRGAVIVVHVPSGRVLAMVSLPKYNPNRVEADWERLTRNLDTSPLLNRVIAGLYQPGGALQTVMLSAILGAYPDLNEEGGYVLNSEVPDARDPVWVNDLMLTCLPNTPARALTLAEAYAFGCPAPFAAAMGQVVTPETLWERFGVLGLLDAPLLVGFDTEAGSPPEPLSSTTPGEALIAAAVGQGDLTVTPLQMVQIVATVANQGNGVPLHLVDAVRRPGSETWEPIEPPAWYPALMRADVASAVRLTMLQAAATSPYVRRAQPGDLVLYGHSALSYAGPNETPYAWFLGFVDQTTSDQPEAIAVVVVVENEADPRVAADVARAAFEAAAQKAEP